MFLLRRIVFYLFIVVAIAAAGWAYLYLKESKKPALKAENVIPSNAAFIFSSADFNELVSKLSSQNLVWKEFTSIKEFSDVQNSLEYFDSLMRESQPLYKFFKKREIIFSLIPRQNAFSKLIVFSLDDVAQEKNFNSALINLFSNSKITENYIELQLQDKLWFVKTKLGVTVFSDDKILLEKAFSESERKLKSDKNWQELSKVQEKGELLSAYVNYENGDASSEFIRLPGIFGGHTTANFEFSPDEISINGFNISDSSSVLNTLSSQQPQGCDFLNILPYNTVSFKAYGFHDFQLWRSKLKVNSSFWKQVNDSAMFNAEKQFSENINSKLIEAEVNYREKDSKTVIVEVKDTAVANELIPFISDSVFTYRGIRVGHLNSQQGNILSASFGDVIKDFSSFTFCFGSYLIFTEENLSEYFMNSLLSSSGIMQNENFKSYAKENLGLDFNYLYYCAPNKAPKHATDIFPFIKETDYKSLQRISNLSLTLSNYKSTAQFRVNVKYLQEQKSADTPGLWTFEADTVIAHTACIFVNHKTNENEIVFSDEKNDLYLLNATGGLIWKRHLSERPLSQIYTVDAFKNNKFQMLFNTRNYLHLIDRNGKDVEGFPVKLPAPATNSLTLLDYDGTKDYRLFIACADKKIYNYSVNGIKNEKFQPLKTLAEVQLQLQYLKVAGSDYLLTIDVEGNIYVFSRRGEGRIDFKNRVIRNCKNFFADASGSIQNSRFFYFDESNGLLESISLSDKKDIRQLNGQFEKASYSFDPVDDDKKTDIIIAGGEKLKAYDLTGNEIFSFVSEGNNFQSAIYFYDSEGAYFILSTPEQIMVLDAGSKQIVKKFPATGKPVIADLFGDGKKYILVADGSKMKCVLLR